jgi:hypothetical protein
VPEEEYGSCLDSIPFKATDNRQLTTNITHFINFMHRYQLNGKWIRIYLIFVAIMAFQCELNHADAQSSTGAPPSPSDKSQLESFWENVDTHWGGRLKTSGRVSQTDDDTIFEPVGTGTYWDGSFNFRLINETFFSDSVFTADLPCPAATFAPSHRIMPIFGCFIISNLSVLTTISFWVINFFCNLRKAIRSNRRRIN